MRSTEQILDIYIQETTRDGCSEITRSDLLKAMRDYAREALKEAALTSKLSVYNWTDGKDSIYLTDTFYASNEMGDMIELKVDTASILNIDLP